jgi:hypothetical protein
MQLVDGNKIENITIIMRQATRTDRKMKRKMKRKRKMKM